MEPMVVISRKWHSPAIYIRHLADGIEIDLTKEDFTQAVTSILSSELPPWYQRVFLSRAKWGALAGTVAAGAYEQITEEMKHATIYSPPPPPNG